MEPKQCNYLNAYLHITSLNMHIHRMVALTLLGIVLLTMNDAQQAQVCDDNHIQAVHFVMVIDASIYYQGVVAVVAVLIYVVGFAIGLGAGNITGIAVSSYQ
jgi:hypothetical protein